MITQINWIIQSVKKVNNTGDLHNSHLNKTSQTADVIFAVTAYLVAAQCLTG